MTRKYVKLNHTNRESSHECYEPESAIIVIFKYR